MPLKKCEEAAAAGVSLVKDSLMTEKVTNVRRVHTGLVLCGWKL